MIIYLRTLILIFLVVFAPITKSDEYEVSGLMHIGSFLKDSTFTIGKLNNEPGFGYRLDIVRLFSAPKNLLMGIGYGNTKIKYGYQESAAAPRNDYSSNFKHIYARIGYRISDQKTKIDGAILLGYGELDFSREGGETYSQSSTKSMGIEGRATHSLGALNIIGGISVEKMFVKSFDYENNRFDGADFGINVNVMFGIGFSF